MCCGIVTACCFSDTGLFSGENFKEQQISAVTWSSVGEIGLQESLGLVCSHSDSTSDFLDNLLEVCKAGVGRKDGIALGTVLGVVKIPDVLRLTGVGKADVCFELGVAEIHLPIKLEFICIPLAAPIGVLCTVALPISPHESNRVGFRDRLVVLSGDSPSDFCGGFSLLVGVGIIFACGFVDIFTPLSGLAGGGSLCRLGAEVCL